MAIIREAPVKIEVWGIVVSSIKKLQGLCRVGINNSKMYG